MENPLPVPLIVCEQTGQWAAGLRQELRGTTLKLQETRLLDDAWQSLAAAPAAFVVVEYTAKNSNELLRRYVWFTRDYPQARLAIVAARRYISHRWLLRSAGAVHTVFSPRELAPLAELACRHIAQIPQPQLPVTERIWRSLPWGKSGATSITTMSDSRE